MTTIVYRDGELAADSRAYAGFNATLGIKSKIRKTKGGVLLGCSSNKPGQAEAVMDWYIAGADIKKVPSFEPVEQDFTLLVVLPDGTALYGYSSFHLSGPLTAPFFAIGSGALVALGALQLGASASVAVEAACVHDIWSGPPIEVLRHRMAEDFVPHMPAIRPFMDPETMAQAASCKKCGIRLDGTMGYVCQASDCPHFARITC